MIDIAEINAQNKRDLTALVFDSLPVWLAKPVSP